MCPPSASQTRADDGHRPAAVIGAGDGAHSVPSNVPSTLSSFVGRTAVVVELLGALATQRLLTVVGPGGAGKTRLAREVAAALSLSPRTTALHPDGVWWVELAPVRLGSDVAGAVASALSINPTPGRRLVDALIDGLRGQRLLLVLDNCEHVILETAQLVDAVLRTAPDVTILCTSREALSTEGEVAWPIRALPRPSSHDRLGADEAAAFEAVQLFVERARSVTPGFALTDGNAPAIATICERLDGLPLALELAAAVVPVLGVEAIAARIDDALTLLSRGRRTALPRHRTLHAVLDWSYALLEEDERALLRQLSVFRGSFTLDAMADVCGARGAEMDLLPALGRLVEHSLVEVREDDGEARYRLLETIRQFGSAALSSTPEEDAVRRRHAGWVAAIAADAEPALFSPARGRTVERLRGSIDEIRAALTWAAGPSGSPMLGARIAGMLAWFWISGVPWE
ncbi:MAG TPA: AAA family ATPase, partial [Gemmatimonas sp.]|nr:AAA family ATPase [Gemmatimonas sp.]